MRATVLLLAAAAFAQEGMVAIPEGEFTMGRTKLTKDDSTTMRPVVLLDDRPPHKVRIAAFSMDAAEVTQSAYAKFVAQTKRRPPYHWLNGAVPTGEENFPVYNVDWEDASGYCAWVGKRLPTEAEWERAARGGLEGMSYPNGDKLDAKSARYGTQSGPASVGKFAPNAFGLFDMAGGVSEWTADWFEREYYKSSPDRDPKGPAQGRYKVIRGGAWSDSAPRCTVFFRNWVRPNHRTPNLGFRCVK